MVIFADVAVSHPSYVAIYIAAAVTMFTGVAGWVMKDTVTSLRGLRGEQSTQSVALAVIVERTQSIAGDQVDHEVRIRLLESGHQRLTEALRHMGIHVIEPRDPDPPKVRSVL